MNNLCVAKFGGTSMGTVQAMESAAEIVRKNPQTKLVVVSACSGTTNQLLKLYEDCLAQKEGALTDTLGAITHRHLEMARVIGCATTKLQPLFSEISDVLALLNSESPKLLDQLLSIGERLSSVLFTALLMKQGVPTELVDARTILRTDSNFGKAEPLLTETRALSEATLSPKFASGQIVVTQGFIGCTNNGATTTLGRGGSDYSAALLAEALQAERLEIWTDVDGIYTMDPRVVPNAKVISVISFAEASELANFGAKILHPATLVPAMRAGSVVFVGNTFRPEAGGTTIHKTLTEKPLFRAVAVRHKQTLLTLSSLRMVNAYGFLARIFSLLAEHRLSVDLVTTSEASVALTIDGTNLGSAGKSILDNQLLFQELRTIADLQVEDNLSVVALIGNRLDSTPQIAVRAFEALDTINVRAICQGASTNNFCFLLNTDESHLAVQKLHEEFLCASQ